MNSVPPSPSVSTSSSLSVGKFSFDPAEYRISAVLTLVISVLVLTTAAIGIMVINKSVEKDPTFELQFSGQKGYCIFMLVVSIILILISVTVLMIPLLKN